MLDILVAEIGLQAAGIDASIGELEAASVAQHVRMNPEIESGDFTQAREQCSKSASGKWRTALRGEHKRRLRFLFAL